MANLSKHAFGKRENIEAAKQAGTIDEYDVLYLDNGEIGWVDRDGETVISTTRTQESVTVNGVTGLGIANGATIPAGISFDDFVAGAFLLLPQLQLVIAPIIIISIIAIAIIINFFLSICYSLHNVFLIMCICYVYIMQYMYMAIFEHKSIHHIARILSVLRLFTFCTKFI